MLMPLAIAAMVLKIPICRSEPMSINAFLCNAPPLEGLLSLPLLNRPIHGIIRETKGEGYLRGSRRSACYKEWQACVSDCALRHFPVEPSNRGTVSQRSSGQDPGAAYAGAPHAAGAEGRNPKPRRHPPATLARRHVCRV